MSTMYDRLMKSKGAAVSDEALMRSYADTLAGTIQAQQRQIEAQQRQIEILTTLADDQSDTIKRLAESFSGIQRTLAQKGRPR